MAKVVERQFIVKVQSADVGRVGDAWFMWCDLAYLYDWIGVNERVDLSFLTEGWL